MASIMITIVPSGRLLDSYSSICLLFIAGTNHYLLLNGITYHKMFESLHRYGTPRVITAVI